MSNAACSARKRQELKTGARALPLFLHVLGARLTHLLFCETGARGHELRICIGRDIRTAAQHASHRSCLVFGAVHTCVLELYLIVDSGNVQKTSCNAGLMPTCFSEVTCLLVFARSFRAHAYLFLQKLQLGDLVFNTENSGKMAANAIGLNGVQRETLDVRIGDAV